MGYFVDHLDELPPSGWLYIRAGTTDITLTTECYPVEIDSREASEEEMVAFETDANAAGFNGFLCDAQIRDVDLNLRIWQRP